MVIFKDFQVTKNEWTSTISTNSSSEVSLLYWQFAAIQKYPLFDFSLTPWTCFGSESSLVFSQGAKFLKFRTRYTWFHMILSLDRLKNVFRSRANCKENIFAGCAQLQLGFSQVGKRRTGQPLPTECKGQALICSMYFSRWTWLNFSYLTSVVLFDPVGELCQEYRGEDDGLGLTRER
jgi:hypothetical protein